MHPTGALPNFVVVGAMRSGTSSLARWLRTHPEVFMSTPKELHFFDREYHRGLDWYRSHFAGAGGEAAVGEATPNYLYRQEALDRMAAVLPDAKLVVVLREPVERAYSHYWMERLRGREERSFADAAAEELRLVARGDPAPAVHAYLDRGRYRSQLVRLGNHYQRQSMLVMLFDDLVSAPVATFQSMCSFLSVDDSLEPIEPERPVNRSVSFRSLPLRRLAKRLPGPLRRPVEGFNTTTYAYPPIDPALAAELRESLAEDNRSLAGWLGRDLDAWLPS